MLKYFFHLFFQYEVEKDPQGEPVTSIFNLGYFSTKEKAKEKINEYKNIIGFKDYSIDCFKIKKYRVNFTSEIIDKGSVDVYELTHEYEDDEYDYYNFFGLYESEEEAEKAKLKLIKTRKFSKYPDGFYIAKWAVDRDFSWLEGFTSWDDD